jgi:ribosomal-protein-alanine N-acetyltransferase
LDYNHIHCSKILPGISGNPGFTRRLKRDRISVVRKYFPEEFPKLTTERLLLRPLSLSDAPAVFRNFSDPEVVRYFMEPLTDLEGAETMVGELMSLFEQGKAIFWAVILVNEAIFLGTCSFEKITAQGCGEVGFDLALAWWGRGLMSEALRAVLRYGFETLALKEIEAITSAHNRRAITLLTRLGFQITHEEGEDYRLSLKRVRWKIAGLDIE